MARNGEDGRRQDPAGGHAQLARDGVSPRDGEGIVSGMTMRERLTNGTWSPPHLTKAAKTKRGR